MPARAVPNAEDVTTSVLERTEDDNESELLELLAR